MSNEKIDYIQCQKCRTKVDVPHECSKSTETAGYDKGYKLLSKVYQPAIGYITWVMVNGDILCFISTDHGPKIIKDGIFSKKDYPELYAALQPKSCDGDDENSFRLPDLSGCFSSDKVNVKLSCLRSDGKKL